MLPASNRCMALPPLPSWHPGPVISKLVTAPPGSSAAASSASVGLSFSVGASDGVLLHLMHPPIGAPSPPSFPRCAAGSPPPVPPPHTLTNKVQSVLSPPRWASTTPCSCA